MPASSEVPNGGNGSISPFHNSKLSPQSPTSPLPAPPTLPQHRWKRPRWSSTPVVVICLLLAAVIILQIVILCIIINPYLVQNATSSSLIAQSQAGQGSSELTVRGQILQLADLLNWDAKCNRVLHDLVVSCYGAPDYLARRGKETSKSEDGGNFQFNRNFPHNLETSTRSTKKQKMLRPLKSAPTPTEAVDQEKRINQSQQEKKTPSVSLPSTKSNSDEAYSH